MCLHPILALGINRYTHILSNNCDTGKEYSGMSYSSNKMTKFFDQKPRVAASIFNLGQGHCKLCGRVDESPCEVRMFPYIFIHSIGDGLFSSPSCHHLW